MKNFLYVSLVGFSLIVASPALGQTTADTNTALDNLCTGLNYVDFWVGKARCYRILPNIRHRDRGKVV